MTAIYESEIPRLRDAIGLSRLLAAELRDAQITPRVSCETVKLREGQPMGQSSCETVELRDGLKSCAMGPAAS